MSNGVGDGQLQVVYEHEVKQFLKALTGFPDTKTSVVLVKRELIHVISYVAELECLILHLERLCIQLVKADSEVTTALNQAGKQQYCTPNCPTPHNVWLIADAYITQERNVLAQILLLSQCLRSVSYTHLTLPTILRV